jgi:hypothetical protein
VAPLIVYVGKDSLVGAVTQPEKFKIKNAKFKTTIKNLKF